MPTLSVQSRDGEIASIDAQSGMSLMEAIRKSGNDELQALCSGACACATCHVYIADLQNYPLPPMSADENDLLDGSDHRTAESRLACQIPIDDDLAAMRVTIAPDS